MAINNQFIARYKYVGLLILLATIWSSSFTMIKVAVETVPPTTLVAVRLTIAAVFLVLFLRIQGRQLPRGWHTWGVLFLVGLVGNSLPFFLISWGEMNINSGRAAVLMAIMPLATLFLAHFFTESDKITTLKFIGMTVGFVGVILLIGTHGGNGHGVGGQGSVLLSQIAIMVAALSYAVSTVMVRRLPAGGNPVERSAGMMICAAIQMVPLSLLIDQPWLLEPSAASMMANLYIGLVPTALASILYFQIIAARGTAFFSAINYMIPCMGIVWGAVFLDEDITLAMALALLVILSGIAIANLKRDKNNA